MNHITNRVITLAENHKELYEEFMWHSRQPKQAGVQGMREAYLNILHDGVYYSEIGMYVSSILYLHALDVEWDEVYSVFQGRE